MLAPCSSLWGTVPSPLHPNKDTTVVLHICWITDPLSLVTSKKKSVMHSSDVHPRALSRNPRGGPSEWRGQRGVMLDNFCFLQLGCAGWSLCSSHFYWKWGKVGLQTKCENTGEATQRTKHQGIQLLCFMTPTEAGRTNKWKPNLQKGKHTHFSNTLRKHTHLLKGILKEPTTNPAYDNTEKRHHQTLCAEMHFRCAITLVIPMVSIPQLSEPCPNSSPTLRYITFFLTQLLISWLTLPGMSLWHGWVTCPTRDALLTPFCPSWPCSLSQPYSTTFPHPASRKPFLSHPDWSHCPTFLPFPPALTSHHDGQLKLIFPICHQCPKCVP